MKKRVIIDLHIFRENLFCGIANIVKGLCLGLDNLLGAEHFSVYTSESALPEAFPKFNLLKYKSWHKRIHAPFAFRFDIIHVTTQLSLHFYYKRAGQKKIVTLHDLNFLYEPNHKGIREIRMQTVRRNLKNTNVVVCISEFAKNDFLKNRHLFSLPKNQEIKVIYNGLIFPDSENINDIDRFSFLKTKPFILNIAILAEKKNQLSILHMLPHMKEDLVLVVSGSEPHYEKKVTNFVTQNKLENRVHIVRNISDEEKWWLIKNCKALLHPSLAEGFGIPPIEAMYFGKPVFLSQLTSLPEIGGKDAFYFENFEPKHMTETFKKGMKVYDENQESYATKLRNRAMQFDHLKMAKAYLDLYRSL